MTKRTNNRFNERYKFFCAVLCKTRTWLNCYTSQLKYVFWLEENLSVTCRELKFTNSLGKQQLVSTRTWSGRASWNRGKFVSNAASSKRFIHSSFPFLSWEVLNKSLWLVPRETVSSVSPRPQCFPSGKQNSLFPFPVIKCSMTKFNVILGTRTKMAKFSYFHLELNATVAY